MREFVSRKLSEDGFEIMSLNSCEIYSAAVPRRSYIFSCFKDNLTIAAKLSFKSITIPVGNKSNTTNKCIYYEKD